MKNKLNYLVSLFLVCFAASVLAQTSQLKLWTIPSTKLINFVPTTPVASALPVGGLTPSYSGLIGSYGNVAHNSMHDASGNLLFYIAENGVYDKAGDFIGLLDYDPSVTPDNHIYLSAEIAIIPDVVNCDKFYIVTGFKSNSGFSVDYKPHYAILDMSIQNPNFPTYPLKKGKLQLNTLSGTLFPFIGAPKGAFDLHSANLHLAVSRLSSVGGTPHRFIYVANALYIYRYIVNASGISYDASLTPISTGGDGSSFDLRGEMELIDDIPNNKYKLALTVKSPGSLGYKIFTANINYTSGALISTFNIALPNPTSGPLPIPHGIEFSPNGNYLYITHQSSSSLTGNIKYYNFTTSTLNNLVVTSPANYQFSQTELGYGHLISSVMKYPVYFESSNGLAALADANAPTSGITYLSFSNNSTYLPDQIDGEVYFPTCPTLSITGNTNICAGSSSTLTASGASTYTWYPGGYVGSPYVVFPSTTTVYTVVSTQGCCTSTATIKVVVNPNNLSPDFYIGGGQISPTDFTISATPVALATYPTSSFWWEICEVDATGAVVTTPPTTMTNAQTWWYDPFLSFNTFPGYNYTTPASSWPVSAPMSPYPSAYTATNPAPGRFSYGKRYRITRATYGDCIPWTTVSKTIHACTGCKGVNGPSGFIVEDDSYSPPMPGYLMTKTKIENQNEIMNNEIIVSPNPTNGIFSVNMQTEGLRDIYVSDITGRIVFEIKGAIERSVSIDMHDQAEGVYFIRIMDSKSSTVKKVIKQ